ncbi:zinc-dependent alcohol dehydrogenase [Sporanaerobacter sp. PP17-6a]|uniref:zinc-dependent alcohol dehydrogenase n=1 Tax=Sporanaerobacter sp. PP17-6a TaxID=1891289 RepID=UPI0008A0323A|nr:alcohol dehydrogenase catalytic domain-containing protein [Sporanaerobacter sp. PP17-6a]SCL94723.1 D-arabitol-phosphate dehydrogenase [Sporanaerobacter sp. PP17-6a]
MEGKMKVMIMEDIGKVAIRKMDIPKPGPGQVLVRIHQCNICTVDWQTWKGFRKSMGRKFPWAPGHEMAGEIVELGEGVTNPALKIGTHVVFGGQSSRGCGECHFCRLGHPDRCTNKPKEVEFGGIIGSFGFSQYAAYESSRLYPISDNLPYEEAAFVEPTSTCIHGAKRVRIVPGDKVVVIGAGNLGLVNAQVAKSFGGDVMVSEVVEERCRLAQSIGLKTINPAKENLKETINKFTDGRGADVVILAVANTKANDQALEILAPRGRMLFFASGHPVAELHVDANQIHYKEFELIGTYNSDHSDFQLAAELLGSRVVKVDKIISQKIPMDDCQHAFGLASTPGTYRVSVTLD